MIPFLINSPDVSEIVRDQIITILVSELSNQQDLAVAASLSPDDWDIEVVRERSSPQDRWLAVDDRSLPIAKPLVNVHWDNTSFDSKRGNGADMIGDGTFNIDIYAGAASRDVDAGGFIHADTESRIINDRVTRIVRRILSFPEYKNLGLDRNVVADRTINNINVYPPQIDNQHYFAVALTRMTMSVKIAECAPGQDLTNIDTLNINVTELDSGVIILTKTIEGS